MAKWQDEQVHTGFEKGCAQWMARADVDRVGRERRCYFQGGSDSKMVIRGDGPSPGRQLL